MKWNFKKYFYILLLAQFVVFLVMLFITYVRIGAYSDQSMVILQEESYRSAEKELRTRIDLIFTHIESEMTHGKSQVEKIARILSGRTAEAFEEGGRSAAEAYIDELLPEIHSMVYGIAIEVFVCDSDTGSIFRYLGFGNKQDLSEIFSMDAFLANVKASVVYEIIEMGSSTMYICANQSIVNTVVKNYVYNIIHSATYGENAYTWVNEILNYEGGENYAIRIIHPNLKDTEGTFLSTFDEDEAGNLPYLQELEGILKDGEVFQRYYFEAKDGSGISEKISYARLYKPFNWVIATGEQLVDVDAHATYLSEINRGILESMLQNTILVLLGVLLFGSLIIFFIHHVSQNKLDEFIESEICFDELTGLYNRKYFYEAAQQLIDEYNGEACIVRLNVCNFKVINDLYGMEKGDQLLKQIAEDIKKDEKKYKFVSARFSSDVFYICVPQKHFEQLPLIRQINVPWLNIDITLTYGVYFISGVMDVSVSQMCDRANMAIAASKAGTGSFIHIYKDEFRQKILWEKEIEGEMENALATGQFIIYIQPKYDVLTEKVVGGEALVRWQHPKKGIVSPADFIPLFERNGFIRNLDYYVWESCCSFIRCARDKGMTVPPISVNVSRIHFYGKELHQKLDSLLVQYNLDPTDIELEVTETICAEDSDVFLETCSVLQNNGFKIAMDDFGSGYSSLNMLKELPLDVIKMDMRFLDGDQDPKQREKGRDILYSLIEMAQRLQLDIVVEGVETRDQVDFIKNVGQCSAQGYFYARPLPTPEFEAVL